MSLDNNGVAVDFSLIGTLALILDFDAERRRPESFTNDQPDYYVLLTLRLL